MKDGVDFDFVGVKWVSSISHEKDLGRALPLDGAAREALLEMADGDGRAALASMRAAEKALDPEAAMRDLEAR